ncbi:MAG TPA: DUF885 family protein [Opitutaceae bacterium]|nr:DUF885 family protein [Opitutaceae bacterium]
MKLRVCLGLGSMGLLAVFLPAADFRHGQPAQSARDAAAYVPDLGSLSAPRSSELRELVERFREDRAAFERFHSAEGSARQVQRMRAFHEAWLRQLEQAPYDPLETEGRIDWHLLRLQLRYELGLLARTEKRNAEMVPLVPFAEDLARLIDERREFMPLQPAEAASALARIRAAAEEARRSLEGAGAAPASRIAALRAANRLQALTKGLDDWFKFQDGYDPDFGWWTREPYRKLTATLAEHGKFLREKVVGQKAGEDEPIVGDPIGADGLALDLEHEMVPYTPAELIRLAERELAWCEAEWKKVAREMGCGDDWKAALEKVKADHVAPGEQPALIARMAYEAIDFVTRRDLLTVPAHAIDTWRMSMLSPERQKVAPFFLGGEQILVAFPTDTMDHAEKLDSLRANNRHFCRAVVHHELIPGHHLQQWSWTRYNPHRRVFSTPFWVEGWALWWEFRLWDLGFAASPENRAGMLFWRTHRAARIIFSLRFHLGEWTPEQCVDFLVDRVGHDRHTATGEVRRSFNGDYSPLYQVAYMMGAIQLRSLFAELVESGKMREKEFHDRILQGGVMPIEMVRARLMGTKLPRGYASSWKFAGDRP